MPSLINNITTDAGAHVLGILWGIASVSGEGYWVRHRDNWYIDTVREHFGITATVHESYSNSGNQYRLKITRTTVELHSSADVFRIGSKRLPTPRLRIYGNQLLMEEMNRVISAGAEVPLRTPQKTANETTVGLYYCGSSFGVVFQWLYDGASLYNPAVREKFQYVLAKRI